VVNKKQKRLAANPYSCDESACDEAESDNEEEEEEAILLDEEID